MYPAARELQERNSYVCKNCHGEGSFHEEVETIHYESTKKYEQRLKEWLEMNKLNPDNEAAKP